MGNNAPDFVIDDVEALTIADPLSGVLADWGIYMRGGDNKYLALMFAVAGVYAGRVITRVYMGGQRRAQRAREQAAEAAQAPPSNPMGNPAPQDNRPSRGPVIDFGMAS